MSGEYPRVDCIVCGRSVATPTKKGGPDPRDHLTTKKLIRAVILFNYEVLGFKRKDDYVPWCPHPHATVRWENWVARNKHALGDQSAD